MRIIIVILVGMMLFIGCGTRFCFRVDGEYEGKKGGFEYCYDVKKNIFENIEEGKKAVLVTKEQLETIKKEDGDGGQVEAKLSRKLIDILIERVK